MTLLHPRQRLELFGSIYSADATPVCVLSDILSAVSVCLETDDISMQVPPIGVKLCTIVELCPHNTSALLAATSLGVSKCGVKKSFG